MSNHKIINLQTIVRRKAGTVSSWSDGLYVFDPDEKKLHIFNQTAECIWKYLSRPRTIEEIVEKLMIDFDVSPDKATRDTMIFVRKMMRQNIIVPGC